MSEMRRLFHHVSFHLSQIKSAFKSIFAILSKLLLVFAFIFLIHQALLYFSIGNSIIMSISQLISNTFGFSETIIPTLTLAAEAVASVSALYVFSKSALFEKVHNNIKFMTVNLLPSRAFMKLTDYFPIANWLELEQTDLNFGINILSFAILTEDINMLEKILKRTSKDVLYKLLRGLSHQGIGPLQHASLLKSRREMMKMIIDAIEPQERCSVLKSLVDKFGPCIFVMAIGEKAEESIHYVMQSVKEHERWELLNQSDNDGNTLLILLAGTKCTLSEFSTLMRYVPEEKRMDFINKINNIGRTALTYLATHKNPELLKYFLSLIPPEKLPEFFACHDQGKLAVQYAGLHFNLEADIVLFDYGLSLSGEDGKNTLEKIQRRERQYQAKEGFKEKMNAYPEDILEITQGSSEREIKTAYRQQLRRFHPDKLLGQNQDDSQAKKIISAYEFLTKDEALASYIKKKQWRT